MNAAQHLAQYGVSFQQARDFVYANLDQPAIIYQVALNHGVTSAMLAEIYGQGVNAAVVENFFQSQGLDGSRLSASNANGWESVNLEEIDWSAIEESLLELSTLYRPFETDGVLSARALTSRILEKVSLNSFNALMETSSMDHNQDGIVTAEEAEAPGMPSFAATVANGAAHNYGFLIRALTALDSSEVQALEALLKKGPGSTLQQTQDILANYMDSLVQAMLTPANPAVMSNEEVADIIVTGVVSAIAAEGDTSLVLLSAVSPTLFG